MPGHAHYRFLTTWLVAAPIGRVWDVVYAIDRWPEWWRGVKSVTELVHGDGDGEGSVYRHVWRSKIPYAVRFDSTVEEVWEPNLILARAVGEASRNAARSSSTSATPGGWPTRARPRRRSFPGAPRRSA